MQFKQSVITCSVATALMALSGVCVASGLALLKQSASGMGNAFAGGAASAEDASTIFLNPAGMSRLSGNQIVVSIHGIKPSAKFSDASASATAGAFAKNGNGGDADSLAWVSNDYFSMALNLKTHIGLGINTPFGLQTK